MAWSNDVTRDNDKTPVPPAVLSPKLEKQMYMENQAHINKNPVLELSNSGPSLSKSSSLESNSTELGETKPSLLQRAQMFLQSQLNVFDTSKPVPSKFSSIENIDGESTYKSVSTNTSTSVFTMPTVTAESSLPSKSTPVTHTLSSASNSSAGPALDRSSSAFTTFAYTQNVNTVSPSPMTQRNVRHMSHLEKKQMLPIDKHLSPYRQMPEVVRSDNMIGTFDPGSVRPLRGLHQAVISPSLQNDLNASYEMEGYASNANGSVSPRVSPGQAAMAGYSNRSYVSEVPSKQNLSKLSMCFLCFLPYLYG